VNIRDTYLRLGRRQRRRMRPGPEDPAIQSPDSDSGHAIIDLFERLVAEAIERGADGDRITAALEQATQAATDVLAERLRADAPRMLREHQDFRRGFEQRLQQRRGPALDLYECVRVCCLEAGEEFTKRCSQQADGPDPKLGALTMLHARACLVASEVQSMLRSGHAALGQLLGEAEVFGARHRVLAFSAVAASHSMIERRYRLTKVPRPGTVCTRPSCTRMSMARRTVPTARPVCVVRSVIEGSWEVISPLSVTASGTPSPTPG
jgi:hypothetical protein